MALIVAMLSPVSPRHQRKFARFQPITAFKALPVPALVAIRCRMSDAVPLNKGADALEIHFTPEITAKLTISAARKGRNPDEFVQDVLAQYLNEEAVLSRL